MKHINYYNHKIAYDLKGKGTTLVFLHGFGENRQMWSKYTAYFSDYQVLTIDLPNAGDSAVMEASIARKAKVVNAVLMAEGIEKCIMVGHSMGGYITLAFAKLYAAKLLGYCLFHSQPNADTPEKKQGRNKAIDFVNKHGSESYFKGLMPMLFAKEYLKDNEAVIQKLIDFASQIPSEGTINQLKAMRDRPDNQAVLKSSRVPVCFIIGENDIAIPAENSLNQTFLPNTSDIHILPNVGHMSMFEAPLKTVGILNRFIDFVVA
ncbi:MAG: alpha/beta fold hydrolase [Saprospiraceae bacterium]